jgi:hypothetical protein
MDKAIRAIPNVTITKTPTVTAAATSTALPTAAGGATTTPTNTPAVSDDPSTSLRTGFGGSTLPGASQLGVHVKASLVKAAQHEKAFSKA